MTHLWEEDHSYYCDKDGSGEKYSNLEDFLDEWGECDMDYNLLFRWDWEEYNPSDYEYEEDETEEEHSTKDTLYVFWMHQRKGRYHYCEVKVTKDEEDQVKEFLKPRWEYMKAIWEPLA
jgi:hypothetical protein